MAVPLPPAVSFCTKVSVRMTSPRGPSGRACLDVPLSVAAVPPVRRLLRTHTFTHTHLRAHAPSRTRTFAHMHMHIHARTHTFTHTHIYEHAHAHSRTFTHTHIHTYAHSRTRIRFHARIRTRKSTHTHTQIHTHMQTVLSAHCTRLLAIVTAPAGPYTPVEMISSFSTSTW